MLVLEPYLWYSLCRQSPPLLAVVLSPSQSFEHPAVSVHNLYRLPPVARLETGKPGLLGWVLASAVEGLDEATQYSATHLKAQALPLGVIRAYIDEYHQAVIARLVQFRRKGLVGTVLPLPPVCGLPRFRLALYNSQHCAKMSSRRRCAERE